MEHFGSQWTNFHHKILYLSNFFFENMSRKLNFHWNLTRINNRHFTWRQANIFVLYTAQLFLEWEMFHTKVVERSQNTHFIFITLKKNSDFLWVMWKNMADAGRSQMAIRRMRIACWITKATDTQSDYVRYFFFSTATTLSQTRLNVA